MNLQLFFDIISYTIPSVITGTVAYYFFLTHVKSEQNRHRFLLLKENQKDALPIRLQAYERMALFLERMNLSNLLVRITSVNNDKQAYVVSIINTIEQEFEHNLSQQIYMTDQCWSVIVASKNATIHSIKKTAENEKIITAQDLREEILRNSLNSISPVQHSLTFIKSEVASIF
ncbi:hypothetical protein [Lutibacter sp.]|uniref:DUF7935 family protein n=1 Tax=Lutibacter sp. TaxID=1925666 RepID=UPI002732C72C|nr:hypothetical protein [Lutibacter sp.]MDP3311916.1 hypothetical protein [Lutibacter sp.]